MKKLLLAFFCALSVLALYAQPVSSADSSLLQGFESYRNEDWHSAVLFLRRAVSQQAVSTDEVWFMLIMSEMYAGEYASAQADCERFSQQFLFSQYAPYIQYQKGRCLYFLHQNENAVLVLSDFCHQNPKHDLYASALYWIAEAFFAEYNYEAARGLYERIVADFPNDTKAGAARYRIESIDQRGREEKLLYLLKVTGEENLASREEYERRLREYETEDRFGLRQQLSAAERRIMELERELASKTAAEASGVHDVVQPLAADGAGEGVFASGADAADGKAGGGEDPDVIALKHKARQLQYLLDEQKNTETTE